MEKIFNRLPIIVLFILSAFSVSYSNYIQNKIEALKLENPRLNKDGMIGGKKGKITSYPYVAALLKNNTVVGTSVLIDKRWALTSAKNIQTQSNMMSDENSGYTIRVGSIYPDKDGMLYEITSVFPHQNFSGYSDNNIALLLTTNEVQKKRGIKFIKLLSDKRIKNDIKVIGWGAKNKNSSKILKYLELDVLYYDDCKKHYLHEEHFTHTSFCTAILNQGPCSLDQGGPVVYNKKLLGIFSGTKVCGSIVFPAIYTNITYYTDWIYNTIKRFS